MTQPLNLESNQLPMFADFPEGFTLQPLGSVIDPSAPPSLNEVADLIKGFGDAERCVRLNVGDLVNYALNSPEFKDPLSFLVRRTGLERSTLYNYAYVARRVPLERRRPRLSYEIHRLVAPLSEDEQIKWLDLAEQHGLKKERLAKSILLGRVATDDDMLTEPGGGIKSFIPHANRIQALGAKMLQGGSISNAAPEQLFSLHRDLLPAVMVYAAIVKNLKAKNDDFVLTEELENDLEGILATLDS